MTQRRRARAGDPESGRRWKRVRSNITGALLLCLALGPTGERAADADTATPASGNGSGVLHGMVRLGQRLAGRRVHFSLYPDPSLAAPKNTTHSLADEMANVVVYFESAPALVAAGASRPGPFRMEQRQETFLPHVLTVMAGTEVEFPNVDPIYHNVFSLSKTSSFDLGRYPKGSSRSVRLDKTGIVKVFCHIHSDMSAVIMVLDHSFFAVPDANGEFSITGIPPGRYTVTGWHERARAIHREVTIESGGQTEISLDIPLEESADGQ